MELALKPGSPRRRKKPDISHVLNFLSNILVEAVIHWIHDGEELPVRRHEFRINLTLKYFVNLKLTNS